MIRSILAFAVLGLAALFGYFFVTARSDQCQKERAKQAVAQTADAVMDKGAAAAVSGKLMKAFGLEKTRFLHVHFDEGIVTIYGLAPDSVSREKLDSEIRGLPGVKDVKLVLQPLPEHLSAQSSAGGATGGG